MNNQHHSIIIDAKFYPAEKPNNVETDPFMYSTYQLYAKPGELYCEYDYFWLIIFWKFKRIRRVAFDLMFVNKYIDGFFPKSYEIHSASYLHDHEGLHADENGIYKLDTISFIDSAGQKYNFCFDDSENANHAYQYLVDQVMKRDINGISNIDEVCKTIKQSFLGFKIHN